jgi:hypothetical protein
MADLFYFAQFSGHAEVCNISFHVCLMTHTCIGDLLYDLDSVDNPTAAY